MKAREYVQAARMLGARDGWIGFRHGLSNCLSPLIVRLVFAYAVVAEVAPSFIGVGPPADP